MPLNKRGKLVFQMKKLAQSELQLLLLYFANEYTSRHYRGDLKALVICENGSVHHRS